MIRILICACALFSGLLSAQEDTVKVSIGQEPEQLAELDYNNGLEALQKKDFNTAVELFTRSLIIKPGFDKALSNRAIAYTNLKRYEEALSDIRQAIMHNPENEEHYFNKSLIFAGLAQRDSQEVALDQCLAIKPQHPEANYYKGLIAFGRKDLDQAQTFTQRPLKASQIMPSPSMTGEALNAQEMTLPAPSPTMSWLLRQTAGRRSFTTTWVQPTG